MPPASRSNAGASRWFIPSAICFPQQFKRCSPIAQSPGTEQLMSYVTVLASATKRSPACVADAPGECQDTDSTPRVDRAGSIEGIGSIDRRRAIAVGACGALGDPAARAGQHEGRNRKTK
jgi:hypothetical protein